MRHGKSGSGSARARGLAALALGATATFALAMTQLGGYTSDFEGLVADADGEILTGQDGYYLPAGGTSVDYLAYTYGGTTSVCSTTSAWSNNSSTSGTAADTCGSDDVYFAARRATFTPASTLLLTNTMTFDASGYSGGALTFNAEVSIDNAGVTNVRARLVLVNQAGGSNATILSAPLSTADTVVSLVAANGADFIDGSGVATAQVVFVQTSGGPNWNGRIDDGTLGYAGANSLGVPQNPDGDDQFVAGNGPAGGFFARAQRDIVWPTPIATVSYDVSASFEGTLPTGQNVGSFSTQDNATTAGYIHLFTWVDTNTATNWNAGYLMFNAAGTQDAQPGQFPGPEWQNLNVDHWYRFTTVIDFAANRVTSVSITDLNTGTTTTVDVSGLEYYLRGGAAGGFPLPTGFRFFAGGGVAGNTLSWDNPDIN